MIKEQPEDIYVFDMDGTITPARLSMTVDFARRFIPFLQKHVCFIATGSDMDKVQEQVPQQVRKEFKGIYCSMGNELWVDGKVVYKKEFHHEEAFLKKLEEYRLHTTYPYTLFPNYLEKRIGMVNFSVLGRDCPYEERQRYYDWDVENKERLKIQKEMSELFPQYEYTLGGIISLDIVRHGYGKEQIADDLRTRFPTSKIFFFGDRTFQGGNDFALADRLKKMKDTLVVQISRPNDVLNFLKI